MSRIFQTVLRFVWKIRDTNMVDSLAVWRAYTGAWPPGCTWSTPPPTHPWKESGTFTQTEIDAMITNGIANNPTLPEEPKSFSEDLVPSGAAASTRGDFNLIRTKTYLAIRANAGGTLPSLTITNGHVYQTLGDATWTLYSSDGLTVLESGTIPPDQPTVHTLTFSTTGAGNYFFTLDDKSAGSVVTWPTGAKVSYFATSEKMLYQVGRVTRRYFYVPKGTQYVMAHADSISDCKFYTANGTLKLTQPVASYVDVVIPVSATEDDQIWYVTGIYNKYFFFWNIPGLLATSPDELLIPREAYANLVPSGLTASTRGAINLMRGKVYFYLRTRTDGTLPPLNLSNGWSYTDPNHIARWTLYTEDGSTQLQTGTIPPDQVTHIVNFTTPSESGTYMVLYDDTYNTVKNSSKMSWTAGDGVVIAAQEGKAPLFNGRATRLYFFVPKGAATVAFTASSALDFRVYAANGTQVLYHPGGVSNPSFSIPVGAGQDNQCWYMTSVTATSLRFTNVPGYVSLNANEMLVPHWVLTDQ